MKFQKDKLYHFVAGSGIAVVYFFIVNKFLVPKLPIEILNLIANWNYGIDENIAIARFFNGIGLFSILLIAILKELYDKKYRYRKFDSWDIIFTFIGGLITTILCQLFV